VLAHLRAATFGRSLGSHLLSAVRAKRPKRDAAPLLLPMPVAKAVAGRWPPAATERANGILPVGAKRPQGLPAPLLLLVAVAEPANPRALPQPSKEQGSALTRHARPTAPNPTGRQP
jgi:hypothetical protein